MEQDHGGGEQMNTYMTKGLLVLAAIVLPGCATLEDAPTVTYHGAGLAVSPVGGAEVKQVKSTVDVDPRLLVKCVELPQMLTVNPSPDDVLAQKAAESGLYAACRSRHSSLVELVRQAFNLKP